MNRDDFERLKEAEKAHLRKLKELKETLFGARRVGSIRQALDDMTSSERRLVEENEDLVRRMTEDAAVAEARADIALESQATQAARDPEADEEELRRARAQALVSRLRGEMAAGPPAPAGEERATGEKTIGRPADPEPARGRESDGKPLPDKTIGRMRP